jgi:hypothetical protein
MPNDTSVVFMFDAVYRKTGNFAVENFRESRITYIFASGYFGESMPYILAHRPLTGTFHNRWGY